MRKVIISAMLATILCVGSPASTFAQEITNEIENEDGTETLSVMNAIFTEGEGISRENEKAATSYDEEHNLIVNLAQGTEITYTVPEGIEGTYDMYLTVSKILAQFSSQPFSYSVNDGEIFSVPIDCQVPADAAASHVKDSEGYDTGEWTDTGRFLIKSGLQLRAGDTIKVIASFGARAAELKGIVFPGIGDIILAPAGANVATGYDAVAAETEEIDPNDPLSGLHIIWLGSSVTYGAHAGGQYSMADAIEDRHAATICDKYAVSATTLVNDKEDSYVSRMKMIPKDSVPDLFIVQLSTNDATTGKEFGEVTDSWDASAFDDTTIAGAIETIISYVKETFGCPVVFYTGSYCEKENYSEMVDLLLQIQEKWGIGVIDMYNNAEMTEIFGTDLYNSYMSDQIHPKRKGYIEWWTPFIEESLIHILAENE